jgi:hypothetical protein
VQAVVGDKVRVKVGPLAGERGIVEAVETETLAIRLEKSDGKVKLRHEQVTNFSLAARKAWVTGPDRAVGRRKGTKLYDRISVTLRIDRELWERFLRMEKTGHIEDRTGMVNSWFREKLTELDGEGRQS